MLATNRCKPRFELVMLAFLAIAVVLSPQHAWGQFTTASLGGTVRDSSGAAVPDAAVNVLNLGTGFTQEVSTGANGAFLFPRLPIGTYLLRIEKAGFSAYVQDQIALSVDQAANLAPITLQIGQITY